MNTESSVIDSDAETATRETGLPPLPKALAAMPRLPLCRLPTPIQRMQRVEAALGLTDGTELYIKRDDLTGLAFGGNKGRKLEFVLAEAQRVGADTVLTSGGLQSNHARQTAIAARALGMTPHLFLKGERPESFTGNLLPSVLVDTEFHFVSPDEPDGPSGAMKRFAKECEARGGKPFIIPGGACSPSGSMGYVLAVREIMEQEERLSIRFDWVFSATGTGGTQAGLLAGKELLGLSARIAGIGVSIPKSIEDRQDQISRLANHVIEELGGEGRVAQEEVQYDPGYVGTGYSISTPAGEAAVKLVALQEGIFLDNTYTGKAMSGLLDYLKQGRIRPGERVLFLHTGGNLALFA